MQQFYSLPVISSWDRFYRANFINSMSGFKSASLIATIDQQGVSNLAIFSNIVHLGADPALIGFINRPRETAPHTIANIEAAGVYTINTVTASIVEQAHQTSAKYADGESEFAATGLTEEYVQWCKAPFVKESTIKYAMELNEIIPIKQNNTFLVVGAITGVLADDDILQPDGFLAFEKAGIVTSLGIDAYYKPERIARFSYAKAEGLLRKID